MSKKSNTTVAEKPRTKRGGAGGQSQTAANARAELPDFLKPADAAPVEKQKPGPKAGVLKVTSPCPYCGEAAHRKALQTLKGQGTYRRMYCANGCGHYHYRHPETNEVVDTVGRGPRVSPFQNVSGTTLDAANELDTLRAELKTVKQALKRAERELKNAPKSETPATDGDWLQPLAASLGIKSDDLRFTADDGKGRPRALVNCLSDADIAALPSAEDRETIGRLHQALLTVQACIRAYKGKK